MAFHCVFFLLSHRRRRALCSSLFQKAPPRSPSVSRTLRGSPLIVDLFYSELINLHLVLRRIASSHRNFPPGIPFPTLFPHRPCVLIPATLRSGTPSFFFRNRKKTFSLALMTLLFLTHFWLLSLQSRIFFVFSKRSFASSSLEFSVFGTHFLGRPPFAVLPLSFYPSSWASVYFL